MTLPPGWRELSNPTGPATWAKGHDDSGGVLQASMTDGIATDADLAVLAEGFAQRFGGQSVDGVATGTCAYGRYGHAAVKGGRPKYIRIWPLLSERSPLVMFTWISDDNDGIEAEQIVMRARPAKDVSADWKGNVLNGVRSTFKSDGEIVPVALLRINGTIEPIPITIRSPSEVSAFAYAIKTRVRNLRADAIALLTNVEFQGPDGTHREGVSIYLETPSAWQQFMIPIVEKSGLFRKTKELGEPVEVHRSPADELSDFFASGS